MSSLSEFIKNHEVLSFFVLTYIIAWGSFALLVPFAGVLFADGQIQILAVPLLMLTPFAPALSGIITTTIVGGGSPKGSIRTQFTAFLVALIPTLLIFLLNPNLRTMYDYTPTVVAVSVHVAMIPAFVISSGFSGKQGVREYLVSLVKPGGSVSWYLIAVSVFPALYLLGAIIMKVLGQDVAWIIVETEGGLGLAALIAITFLYQFVYGNCIGEEPGWRGFAQRKLQERSSPLVAALIVGFVWTLWHFPLWFLQGGPLAFEYLLRQFIFGIAIGLTFTWLYNRSGESILAVGLMHASTNVTWIFLPETTVSNAMLLALPFIVVILDRMWCPLPQETISESEKAGARAFRV